MSENPIDINPTEIKKRIEALLFVASGPVAVAQLAESLNVDAKVVEEHIAALEKEYEADHNCTCVRRRR
jgi:chromosome segregation and condensation protein ScpB